MSVVVAAAVAAAAAAAAAVVAVVDVAVVVALDSFAELLAASAMLPVGSALQPAVPAESGIDSGSFATVVGDQPTSQVQSLSLCDYGWVAGVFCLLDQVFPG